MTGGDVCPICTNATKYQYIMEELVKEVAQLKCEMNEQYKLLKSDMNQQYKELSEKMDTRDDKLLSKIELIAESCEQENKEQYKWVMNLIVGGCGLVIGAYISWNFA